MVYAGRFVAGLGIGQASVVAPVYLSEISPKSIRGLCTTTFAGSVYIGIMLAYFASWGSSLHISDTTSRRWVRTYILNPIAFVGSPKLMAFDVQIVGTYKPSPYLRYNHRDLIVIQL